ncbi:MAG: DUF2784 family protein [Candidatus Zixiibacteriota bacterium]
MPGIGLTVVLIIHLAWALWMIGGVVLAMAGYRWPSLWRWKRFRIAHLAGLLATASVPLWNRGVCPLTDWEWALDTARRSTPSPEPFLPRLIRAILYVNISPDVITVVTVLGAAVTLWVFIRHSPWQSASTR